MRITLMVLLGTAILALPACNEQKLNRLDSESLASDLNAKINLDTAAYEQVSEYVYECQGGKLCVPICHRPPGHPMNAKTKELPLQASRAHLGHGDYL